MIQAGFYECDITPPYGAECPGGFRKRLIRKISDPLKVRAMALSDGSVKAVLIGIDNLGIGPDFLRKVHRHLLRPVHACAGEVCADHRAAVLDPAD